MFIVYWFTIPVWIILIIALLALGLWEAIGGFINFLICAFILLLIVGCAMSVLGVIVSFLTGDTDWIDTDVILGLVGGIVISLICGSLMYDTYIKPYIVKETKLERVLENPEAEMYPVGELVEIKGSHSASGFYVDSSSQQENYVHCSKKRGDITFYTGKNYKYFATSSAETEGCEVYADGDLIIPRYDENIQMTVYEINNCEELRFKFSKEMELLDTWVFKSNYPVHMKMESE